MGYRAADARTARPDDPHRRDRRRPRGLDRVSRLVRARRTRLDHRPASGGSTRGAPASSLPSSAAKPSGAASPAAPTSADGFAAPRVLPADRRRGFGPAIIGRSSTISRHAGCHSATAHADDDGCPRVRDPPRLRESTARSSRSGPIAPKEPAPPSYPGVDFTTVAARPEPCWSAPTTSRPRRAMRTWPS